MKLNNINHIIVLGGSVSSLSFLKLLRDNKIKYHFFTNERMLNDNLLDNKTLKNHLKNNKIKFTSTKNINKNKKIMKIITSRTLGVGFGQPWYIEKKLLNKFNNKILDFMGIPMPKYRGGAHYSWMILNDERDGGCFLQNINENTIQGSSDSGSYYVRYNYKYPKNLKTPNDFFIFSEKKEISFFKNFLKKIRKNYSLTLKKIDEKKSIFFPRLKNNINGFIDWSNSADEIVRFINAFSDPYLGAITFLNGKKIYLKNASIIKKNNYHSFASGLVLNKDRKGLIIAAKKGIIRVNFIRNIKLQSIKTGERLVTQNKMIQNSKKHLKI